MRQADPAVFVDLHATDGSHHGYHVTCEKTRDSAIMSPSVLMRSIVADSWEIADLSRRHLTQPECRPVAGRLRPLDIPPRHQPPLPR